ncbi:MAG: transposase [Planctomycetota bacterium]
MRFLITWTTHNYWLPGDTRGFRTRHAKQYIPPPARFAKKGEPIYNPKQYKALLEFHRLNAKPAVMLNEHQKQVTADSLIGTAILSARECITAVGTYHVHVYVDLNDDMTIAEFCRRAKTNSSRTLSKFGLKGKVWARKYHAKRISDNDLERTRRYVISHKNQKAVIVKFQMK